ncbi:hypothetical protein D3C85_1349670 [compost metagenome]
MLIFGIVYYYTYKNYKGTPADEKPIQTQSPRITDSTNPSPSSAVNATGNGKAATLATATPTPAPTPTPTPVQVKFSSNEKGVDNYIITGAANLNIQFNITGACWIAVNALTPQGDRGEKLREKTYNAGESDVFNLESSAFINVGAASRLQLMVNGTPIPLGDTPNPKRVQLNLQKS